MNMVANWAQDDYIVLRRSADVTVTSRGPDGGREMARQGLIVENTTANEGEAAEIAQEADVLEVVRSCPIRLIEPVELASGAVGRSEPDGHTWGLEAVGALDTPYTGTGVKVAVLDTGIDRDHEAFAGVKLTTANFTHESETDLHGHGTHCAGTIFGRPVGGRRIGVAPGVGEALIAKVLPARGPSNTRSVFEGLLWALHQGANVVSMSLGIDFPGLVEHLRKTFPERDPRVITSQALYDYTATMRACDAIVEYVSAWQAFGQPAILVAATGNESDRRVARPVVLRAAPPASALGVISVGALGRRDPGYDVAHFSNAGPAVAAPGVEVLSAKAGGGLVALSGTSMATPHAAGVAALWAEQVRRTVGRFTIADLTSRLTGSCTMEGLAEGLGRLDVGAGLVRAPS